MRTIPFILIAIFSISRVALAEDLSTPEIIDQLKTTFPEVKTIIVEIDEFLAEKLPPVTKSSTLICHNSILSKCKELYDTLEEVDEICNDILEDTAEQEDLTDLKTQKAVLEILKNDLDSFWQDVNIDSYLKYSSLLVQKIDGMSQELDDQKSLYTTLLVVYIVVGVVGGLILIGIVAFVGLKLRKKKVAERRNTIYGNQRPSNPNAPDQSQMGLDNPNSLYGLSIPKVNPSYRPSSAHYGNGNMNPPSGIYGQDMVDTSSKRNTQNSSYSYNQNPNFILH